ncbi:MAG: response regulator, partial [Desulfohalobiaceae bacterium]|nr:response regulator [Desulfohalobiaceae bacterium]
KILSRYGYTVLEASGGEEALRLFADKQESIDIVLTDVILPGMKGNELARALKKQAPNLKVLYMSGYTDTGVVLHGVLEKWATYLQKPFSPEGLARRLRAVLGA